MAALLVGCDTAGAQFDPVAAPLSVEVSEDSAVTFTLSAYQPVSDQPTFAIVSGPEFGALSGEAPELTYSPDANFLGEDSFTFTVTDGGRTSAEATVTIEVLNTPFYAITLGSRQSLGPEDDVTSRLYRVDERGNISLVGDTGHAVTALTVDPTDGAVYAVTSRNDVETDGCATCLLTLNPTSGAATVVGPIDLDGDPTTVESAVNGLAFTSDGSLFGYSRDRSELIAIDKLTGAAAGRGANGISAYAYGLWVDEEDRLWMFNGNGDAYTIDRDTGAESLVHDGADIAATANFVSSGDLQARGDRDPATGKYWGASVAYGYHVGGGIARFAIGLESATYIDNAYVEVVPAIHDIAFVRE